MEHDCSAGQLDAEGEVAVARLVLDGGDLSHAIRHLADALAFDPRLPDVHEALAELIARAGGPDETLRVLDEAEGQEFIGTIALRAHVCAVAGRWDEAIPTLFAVAAHEPTRSWLDVGWLQRPDLPDLVSPKAMAIAAGRLAQRLDDPVSEDERPPVMPALDLLKACVARHREHPMLLWCGSMLARRLGAFDDAFEWAHQSYEMEPSHQAAVMKGYALRGAGRTDEAVAVWVAEIDRTPDDLELCFDVVDLLAGTDRPAEALEWAQYVLDRQPEHPKARAAALGLRFDLDEDITHLITLADEVREQPSGYAEHVLAKHSSSRAWLGFVPQPLEATVNMLQQVLADHEPLSQEGIEVKLSVVEPPSAFLALFSAFPETTVTIESAPEPDMRIATREVRDVVWQYDGMQAYPAVPPPSEEVAEAVRRVANVRWLSPIDAYDGAVTLSGLDPQELIRVLVHPPTPMDDHMGAVLRRHAPELWVRAVQTWACLGIAHHATDEPWQSSRRREILSDLLFGPEDWVTEAAAFALVTTAWVDPETRADVQRLVVRRMLDLGKAFQDREVTILDSMCRLVLMIPNVQADFVAVTRRLLKALAPE